MVRQRDTLRQLLQSSGNNLDSARTAYSQSLGPQAGGTPGGAAPAAGAATPETPGGGSDQRAAQIADLEQQLKDQKEDAGRTHEMLAQDVRAAGDAGHGACTLEARQRCAVRRCATLPSPPPSPMQLARVREDASTAKSEAARCRAEADFERDRASRMAEAAEMQRQQLEGLMSSSAKYQALLGETERRLASAQAVADEARDTVRAQAKEGEGGRRWPTPLGSRARVVHGLLESLAGQRPASLTLAGSSSACHGAGPPPGDAHREPGGGEEAAGRS